MVLECVVLGGSSLHTVHDINPAMTLRTLNYGNCGNAGFIPSTVATGSGTDLLSGKPK